MGLLIHLRSTIFSAAFLIVFFLFALDKIPTFKISLALLIVLGGMTTYIVLRIGRRIRYLLLPLSTIFLSYALLYFIDPIMQRQLFVVLSTGLYYLSLLSIVRMRENKADATARSFFSIALIVVFFIFYAISYGVYINFAIQLWHFLLVQFLFVYMLTHTSLSVFVKDVRRIILYSICIAFAMMQLAWMVNFWPFGYLTMAAASLMFYYVLWDLTLSFFMDTLSKKRVSINIIFTVILLVLILLTSRWVLVA